MTMDFKQDDKRMGSLRVRHDEHGYRKARPAWPKVCLIGFPFDEGCKRNGGRIGANNGPARIRQCIGPTGTIWNPELNVGFLDEWKLYDFGDIGQQVSAHGGGRANESYWMYNSNWHESDKPPEFSLEAAHEELIAKLQYIMNDGGDSNEDSGEVNYGFSHVNAFNIDLSKYSRTIPVILGGSDDQSYCNGMAFLERLEYQRVHCEDHSFSKTRPHVINIDAHLDVRTRNDEKLRHSGCPFREIMQSDLWKTLNGRHTAFACQGQACAKAHVEFIEQNCEGGNAWMDGDFSMDEKADPTGDRYPPLVWLDTIRKFDIASYHKGNAARGWTPLAYMYRTSYCVPKMQAGCRFLKVLDSIEDSVIYVSFDLDSIVADAMPGVSAPSAVGGLSSAEAVEIAWIAGLHGGVKMLGIAEYNANVDDAPNYRGGRLAANIVYYFCLGTCNRGNVKLIGAPTG